MSTGTFGCCVMLARQVYQSLRMEANYKTNSKTTLLKSYLIIYVIIEFLKCMGENVFSVCISRINTSKIASCLASLKLLTTQQHWHDKRSSSHCFYLDYLPRKNRMPGIFEQVFIGEFTELRLLHDFHLRWGLRIFGPKPWELGSTDQEFKPRSAIVR